MSDNLDAFEKKYKYLLKDKFPSFYSSLQKTPYKYFRLNAVRGIDYLKELDTQGIAHCKDKIFPDVYRLCSDDVISKTVSFLTGGLYIQNPSSLYPVKILHDFLKEQKSPAILDLCASPGGKTTALSEKFNRRGIVVANEAYKSRLKSLHFNLEKYGAWNVKTTSFDGRIVGKYYPESFDGILLDAPCSNENKFFLNDEVRRNWSHDLVKRMQKLQQELILAAFDALAPGGVLVYSTCTFSVEENEHVIERLMEERASASLLNISHDECQGLSGNTDIDSCVMRVLPCFDIERDRSFYDGFFVAAVKKEGELNGEKQDVKGEEKLKIQIQYYFDYDFQECIFFQKKGIIFMEAPYSFNAKFHKTGIKAGKFAGDKIEISSQLLWELGKYAKNEFKTNLNLQESIDYLNGYDIRKSELNVNNPIFAYYKEIPVGTVKLVNGMLKNKLDRYFLYGR